MSIDINRVITVLEQSSSVLESKELLLSNIPSNIHTNKAAEKSISHETNPIFNIITQPIDEIVNLAITLWGQKVSQLSNFYPVYKKHSKILQ